MNPYGADSQIPNRIIVHAMGEFIRAPNGKPIPAAEFLESIHLSAHVLVTSYGGLIRLRDDEQGAWHAKDHNTNTLGIEFLVPGIHNIHTFYDAIGRDYLTEQAYTTGKHQILDWLNKWDIKTIERHSDIDPQRKRDPGKGFPWKRLLEDVGMS